MCTLVDFPWCQIQKLYCVKINEQEIDRMFAETLQKQKPNPSKLRSLVQQEQNRSIKKTESQQWQSPFPSAAVPLKSKFRPLEERREKKFLWGGGESGVSILDLQISTSTVKLEAISDSGWSFLPPWDKGCQFPWHFIPGSLLHSWSSGVGCWRKDWQQLTLQ